MLPHMSEGKTTASVQRYLDALAGDQPADPIIRELLDRAVRRLQILCGNTLYRQYPRLTRPPLNLNKDEMLGAIVERLLNALRVTRPTTVRGFFALANQHMHWELTDLARQLDRRPAFEELRDVPATPGASTTSFKQANAYSNYLLKAVETLPEEEREVFGLVKVQGLSHSEAAEVLGVATKTVQRRLQRAMLSLRERIKELADTGAQKND